MKKIKQRFPYSKNQNRKYSSKKLILKNYKIDIFSDSINTYPSL